MCRKSAQELKHGASSSGNHFWFGCGKLKKKIEKCRVSTMKMRSEISALGLKPQVRKHGQGLFNSAVQFVCLVRRHGSIEVVLTLFFSSFFDLFVWLVCLTCLFLKTKKRCPTRTIGSPTTVVSRKTWSRAPTNRRTGTGARPAGGNWKFTNNSTTTPLKRWRSMKIEKAFRREEKKGCTWCNCEVGWVHHCK